MVVNYADLVSQLRATLGRMEVALGAIADAIVWTGKDGRVQWCNAAFDRLANQAHILVLGAKLTNLLPLVQADQPIAPESYPHVKVLSGEYQVTEYEFQSGDRSLVLEISGNSVDLGDGNPSAVLVIRDVTQAKRLEAQRQQAEREREEYLSLLRATLESTADGILVVDMERNVPVYNQKFLQIWSMSESLLLAETSEQRLRFMAEQTPDPDAFIARIWELFTDHAEQDVYDLVELKDGRSFERYSQPQWMADRVIGRVWSFRDITERKQAEGTLSASEAKFRRIVENANDIISLIDLEGQIVYISPNLTNLTGYATSELEGVPFMPFIHPDDHPRCSEAFYTVVTTGQKQSGVEYRARLKNGSWQWQSTNLATSHDANGNLLIISVARDITERKQAEEFLRLSELKYRNIFENSQVGIGRTRLDDGLYLDVNQRYAEIMGYSCAAELIGKRFSTEIYVNPSDRQRLLAQIEQHGEVRNFEEQLRRPDGSTVWGLLSLHPNAEEGCLDFVLADISDRKRTEEALRRSELKFRNLFENSLVGMFRNRIEDGLILDANQRAAELFGFSSVEEVIGKKFSTEFYANIDDRWRMLAELHQFGEVNNFEVQVRHCDRATHWVMISMRLNLEENCVEGVITDISDRKQAEATLQQREREFRTLVENTPDVIIRFDRESHYLYINPRVEKETGVPPSAFLGKTPREMGFPDAVTSLWQSVLDEVFETAQERDIEFELPLFGRNTYQSFRLAPELDSNGSVESVFVVCHDMTEWKQAEEALRQSEVRFRSLYESTSIAVLIQEDGIPIDCNRAAEQLFGYSRQELLSKHPKELSPSFQPNGQESISFANRQIALTYEQGNNRFEWVHRRADGSDFPAEVRLTVFKVGDRKLVQGIVQDLTEQKQAEATLEQRAQIDSLLSSISRQFIDQDVDTAINFALQRVGEFTNSDRSYVFRFHTNRTKLKNTHEWCADGIEPFINEAHDCTADSWSCQILLDGGVLDVPDVNHLPPEAAQDQADWKHQSIQSLLIVPMIHVGEVVGCVGLDAVRQERIWSEETIRLLKLIGEITAIGLARHTAEEAMRVAKEAAEVANRAKSTFLANMSHELRTPLNAILGFAQLMERDAALTPRQRESLTIINRSGEHLLNLINDVLEMSRIEAGRITLNLASFNLHQLLQAIWEMFQVRATAKQLSLQFEIAPDLPQYVLTDEGKLRQVLINLLSNAVKFTHSGGVMLRVLWVTSSASSDSNREEVQRTTDNGQRTIYFEVEDTGRGIAPEEIDSLFQPFVQTMSGTEAREGTGLGLTISRQFVQLMGGDIHVTSNLGQGSTFCFDVQVTLANPADVAPTPTYHRVLKLAPNQPTYRILVVDDRQESCDLIAQLLNVVGFETRAAENGQEAIAQWQTWHPHLIWMDMRMPVMDGYEATRQIRELERHRTAPSDEPTVIIALTASAFEEQQTSIIAMGCDDFVRKPFREQVIFEKMTEYLGVQYIYEEQDVLGRTKDEQCDSSSSPMLYPSSLQAMPAEWIASLHQAALAVDADRILELIEQIPKTHLALAEGLTELVHHFCFDEILELTEGGDDA
jgi:two-component system sensor histidine kinase/response regulator